MSVVIGIDTSNYTTSFTVYNPDSEEIRMEKKLLPVAEGALGLRQSDAVFAHVKQLPDLACQVLDALPARERVLAVGVSAFPRRAQRSYMPCFLVGVLAARLLGSLGKAPVYEFSHQEGHVAAALYSAGRTDLLERPFLAFHLSGGTTDALLVTPDPDHILSVSRVGGTLDLNAGQAVDRVGGMLGLSFPAGPALEELALSCGEPIKTRPVLRGTDCCLSGLQNQCEALLKQGKEPAYVAKYCLQMLSDTLAGISGKLAEEYPGYPMVYAGGVMSNQMIRSRMEQEFQGIFAEPKYSSDNSAGTALLAALQSRRAEEKV